MASDIGQKGSKGPKDRGLIQRDGVWWIQYFAKGKRHREKIGPSKTAAREAYQKRKTQIREDKFFEEDVTRRHPLTVREVVARYLEVSEDNRSRANDLWCARVVNNEFGDTTVEALDPHVIERWMKKRAAERSPATANRPFEFLRRACRKALRDEKIRSDPTVKVKKIKEPSGRVRYLTDDEEKRLQATVPLKWWPLVEFAILTGLRRGEQVGLKREQVDLANRVVTIPRSKNGETRHVRLNSRAVEILRSLLSRHQSEWVFAAANDKRHNNPRHLSTKVLQPALKKAGIKNFRWHDLRHTFCSRLVMAGIPLNTVRELAGHKSIRMTERYSHLAPEHLADAVEVLVNPGVRMKVPPELPPAKNRARKPVKPKR